MRHYPTDAFLVVIFRIHKSQVMRVRERLLIWAWESYRGKISMRDWAFRREHGAVEMLSTIYSVAIDGTEQSTQSSDNPIIEPRFYSTKKQQHSINVLAVVTLDGFVLYLSPSFGGATNDSDVVTRTIQQWYSALEPFEWVLADNGFNGFVDKGIRITTPGTENKHFRKLHSSKRVIVENFFARAKTWRALSLKLRVPITEESHLLNLHNKMWRVVAGFNNCPCKKNLSVVVRFCPWNDGRQIGLQRPSWTDCQL